MLAVEPIPRIFEVSEKPSIQRTSVEILIPPQTHTSSLYLRPVGLLVDSFRIPLLVRL